jgi:UTP--glucose-1-phosphate uridylyltransferase
MAAYYFASEVFEMSVKIRKAVIPVAGLGTRFLPATKSVPKEMLPIVDRPIILHIVEEAIAAGVEDIIFVTGRNKTALEDFFDHTYELEDTLAKQGKHDLLGISKKISTSVNIISVRQKNPLGLGHAVLCAAPIVGREPFAVLLGDEIMQGSPNVTEQLVKVYDQQQLSVVAVMEVPQAEVKKYGIATVAPHPSSQKTFSVTGLIEKPDPTQSKSRWALPGRYVFTAKIFDCLKDTKPSKNNEIQLTDAMVKLMEQEGLLAHEFNALRFDAGDKLGYVCANIEFALNHQEIGSQTREYILNLAERLKKRS